MSAKEKSFMAVILALKCFCQIGLKPLKRIGFMMKENYKKQAEDCVKGAVLQYQKERFEKCRHDPDTFYATLNDGDYFGRVVRAGCEYELGYRKCSCQKVLSGEVTDPEQCECSKESILYILNQLMPQTQVKVEIVETILRGGGCCRFMITVE